MSEYDRDHIYTPFLTTSYGLRQLRWTNRLNVLTMSSLWSFGLT